MGQLIQPPELSLGIKPTFIPKSISQFLGELGKIGSVSEKIFKIEDFVSRLETEIRKIDAFKRELPLCMLLMNDAIVALQEELTVFKKSANQPTFEEFVPLKKTCDEDPKLEIDSGDKKNWLSSTHLWNTNENNSDSNQKHIPKQKSVEQVIQKRTNEQQDVMIDDLYKKEMLDPRVSLLTPGIKNSMSENIFLTKTIANNKMIPCTIPDVQSIIQIDTPRPQPLPQPQPPLQQTSRKQRRCWSPELHRRFVNALHQLGGSKVATPKQIRELMQVDGLTNDEVKSHLQKYRLHTKRFPSNPSNVPLEGLWTPPQDHYVDNRIHSQSGSPDGPLLNCTTATGGTSTTGGDSMDDGEDEKSENNCWKSHLHISGKDNV